MLEVRKVLEAGAAYDCDPDWIYSVAISYVQLWRNMERRSLPL